MSIWARQVQRGIERSGSGDAYGAVVAYDPNRPNVQGGRGQSELDYEPSFLGDTYMEGIRQGYGLGRREIDDASFQDSVSYNDGRSYAEPSSSYYQGGADPSFDQTYADGPSATYRDETSFGDGSAEYSYDGGYGSLSDGSKDEIVDATFEDGDASFSDSDSLVGSIAGDDSYYNPQYEDDERTFRDYSLLAGKDIQMSFASDRGNMLDADADLDATQPMQNRRSAAYESNYDLLYNEMVKQTRKENPGVNTDLIPDVDQCKFWNEFYQEEGVSREFMLGEVSRDSHVVAAYDAARRRGAQELKTNTFELRMSGKIPLVPHPNNLVPWTMSYIKAGVDPDYIVPYV